MKRGQTVVKRPGIDGLCRSIVGNWGSKKLTCGLNSAFDQHFCFVPLAGLEPPTVSLGRNCSSIELQRLAVEVYRALGQHRRRYLRIAGRLAEQ